MNIDTLTVHQALDAMGSEASDGEARALIQLLRRQDKWADTDDVPEHVWPQLIRGSILVARRDGLDVVEVEVEVEDTRYQATVRDGRAVISRWDSGGCRWEWCGNGRVRGVYIEDCPADLGDDVYEALESALSEAAAA